MSFSVSTKRSFSVFWGWRDRALRDDDFLVARFFAFLAINPPVEVNGKAPPSSILARSRLGEAKGSHLAAILRRQARPGRDCRIGLAFGSLPRAVKSPASVEVRSHFVTSPIASRGARPNFLRPRKYSG